MSVLVASTVQYWQIELIRRSSMYAAVQVFVTYWCIDKLLSSVTPRFLTRSEKSTSVSPMRIDWGARVPADSSCSILSVGCVHARVIGNAAAEQKCRPQNKTNKKTNNNKIGNIENTNAWFLLRLFPSLASEIRDAFVCVCVCKLHTFSFHFVQRVHCFSFPQRYLHDTPHFRVK